MTIAGQPIKDQLRAMEPEEFEYFVADLWERDGWKTEVTQSSRDAGVDVVAERDQPVSQKMVIQAKRYGEDNRVGSEDIQQYSALYEQEDADVVAVVTTSSFTESAKERADDLDVRLVDGDDVVSMVQKSESDDVLQDHVEQSHGEVISPFEFAQQVVTRLRLTRGTSYLGAIAVSIVILYAPFFLSVEQPWTDRIILTGWVLVPITSYIYSKAVPEAKLSRAKLVGLMLLPLIVGPYYLYQEF